jgi:hypothetical protein
MPGPVPGIGVLKSLISKNLILRRPQTVSKDDPGSAETRPISLSRVGEGGCAAAG